MLPVDIENKTILVYLILFPIGLHISTSNSINIRLIQVRFIVLKTMDHCFALFRLLKPFNYAIMQVEITVH